MVHGTVNSLSLFLYCLLMVMLNFQVFWKIYLTVTTLNRLRVVTRYSEVIKTLKQTSRQKIISFKENFINEKYYIR